MKYNRNAYLGAGHGIYSVRATKLFTIVADSMGAGHDTIGGCWQCRQQHVPLQGTGHPELLR